MVPDNETFHGESTIGAMPGLGGGTKGRSVKVGDARLRRLSLRLPGLTVARQDGPVAATVATTRRLPDNPAGTLDAWHENLDGPPAALSPGEPTSRFGRIEHARAAYLAVHLPEAMLPAQVAHHAAFLEHEYAVAASFAQAHAAEPGLTCNEWTRRNPFAPTPAA